jgi:SAM-dependent methyltransferase
MEKITERLGSYFNRQAISDYYCQPRALAIRLAAQKKASGGSERPLIFDIGAGFGQHIPFVINAGNNVLALDLDPALETRLSEVVPRGTQLPMVDTIESAIAAIAHSPVEMAAFKRFDATLDPLPQHSADGVVLHRIYSVLPPAGKKLLLENIRNALKPGGLFSFLDFIIDPNPTKQFYYRLSRIMTGKGLLDRYGDFSDMNEDPDTEIMAAIFKKNGDPHFIASAKEIAETEELIAAGEVVIPFVAVHQSVASLTATLINAGFRPIETVNLSIAGVSGRWSVPLINIIAEV